METNDQIEQSILDDLMIKNQPDSDELKEFFVKCSKHNVSDILLQGGSKIWVERYGRQICVSKNIKLLKNKMEALVSELWGDHVRGALRQGKIFNTTFQMRGQEKDPYGLERNQVFRARTNFTQATVNKESETITATLRILNSVIPDLIRLKIEKELFENLLPASGLGIIGGATGSGKTTLQASILQYSGEHFIDRKVITFECPVEYLLGGIKWISPEPAQSEVGVDVPSFADGIALSALRRAPKIISVGELLEPKAMEAAITAGESGHFCIGTEHISSVGEVFPRTLFMFPTEYREAIAFSFLKTLRYVVVQRLVKTLDGKREAVREFFIFDQEIKNFLLSKPYFEWGRIIDKKIASIGQSIPQKSYELFKNDIISFEEMLQVAGTTLDYEKIKRGTYGNE